jgi:hypothetical protein
MKLHETDRMLNDAKSTMLQSRAALAKIVPDDIWSMALLYDCQERPMWLVSDKAYLAFIAALTAVRTDCSRAIAGSSESVDMVVDGLVVTVVDDGVPLGDLGDVVLASPSVFKGGPIMLVGRKSNCVVLQ